MKTRRGKLPDINVSRITDMVKDQADLLDTITSLTGAKVARKSSKRQALLCPFHAEKSPSFYVTSDGSGRGHDTYRCYGCGAHGDVIDFVKDYKSIAFHEAVEYLLPGVWPQSSKSGIKKGAPSLVKKKGPRKVSVSQSQLPQWKPIVPVPDHASIFPSGFDRARGRSAPIHNPMSEDRPVTQLPISLIHPYKDGRDQTYGYVIRSDFKDSKITPFIQWGVSDEGKEGWFISDFSRKNRLPYGYERFVAKLRSKHDSFTPLFVLIVEGEKVCDHAAKFFPDMVVLSWPQGTNNVDRVDWSFLAEADMVVFGPDNDEQGHIAMARILLEIQKVNQTHAYCMGPAAADKGADLADIPIEDRQYAFHLLETARPARETLMPWLEKLVECDLPPYGARDVQQPSNEDALCP